MIVANNLQQAGAGFGTDTNIVTFYKRDGEMKRLPNPDQRMKWQKKYWMKFINLLKGTISMTVAKVIVDVPAKQTNKPFDYRIPTRFTACHKAGNACDCPVWSQKSSRVCD